MEPLILIAYVFETYKLPDLPDKKNGTYAEVRLPSGTFVEEFNAFSGGLIQKVPGQVKGARSDSLDPLAPKDSAG